MMSNHDQHDGVRRTRRSATFPFRRLLPAVLGALLVATAASAGTAPYAESFESYTNDHPIVNESGWSAPEAASALVTTNATVVDALADYATGGKSFPLDTTHAKVLRLSDDVTNEISSAAANVVILDFMALPSHRSEAPAATTNDQFGLYFNMSGKPVVWHHNTTGPTNEWLTLSAGPTVSSTAWHRVRIVADYANDLFQVTVDEGTPITNAAGYTLGGGGQPGSWFKMVQTNGAMARLKIDGEKPHYMDDLVVSNRSLSYSTFAFNEATNNNGAINNTSPMLITLNNDTFTGSNGDDFGTAAKLLTNNVPAGLTVVAVRTNDTQLSVTLTGNATSHAEDDDVLDLTFTFADSAFSMGQASDVEGYSYGDLDVLFFDAPELNYDTTSFTESGANDGSVTETATITIGGRTFAGSGSTNYVLGGDVTVNGEPSGLTVTVTRVSANTATLGFSGNASPHTTSESTSTMEVIFNDGAFVEGNASAVAGYSNSALSVSFYNPFSLSYSETTFSELSEGQIDNTDPVIITLSNDTFAAGTEFVGEAKIIVGNLPGNLAAVAARTGDTTLSVTLTGTATNHTSGDDVLNLTFTFQNSAFANAQASAVANYDKSDLVIDFNDVAVTINPVPYEEPFEDYVDGFEIPGTNGWQASLSSAGIVTSQTDVITALGSYGGATFPMDETNHAQALRITSDITDEIKSGSGGTVYMDFMAYTAYRDPVPAVDTDYQFGFFIDTNGLLNVMHENQSGPVNEWRALAASGTIESNTWIRITVEQDYANHMFQMRIDEGDPISDSAGWTEGGASQPGPWFHMVNTDNDYMSRFAVKEGGVSYVDDLTVRDTQPDFLSTLSGVYFMFR